MKRFSVLVWTGLVSACAASTVAGCGDDDDGIPDVTTLDGGGDASDNVPGQDASSSDGQVDSPDVNVPDGHVNDGSTHEAGADSGTDSGDAGPDAGVDSGDAGHDAGMDSGVDSGVDAGKDSGVAPGCAVGTQGVVASVFPLAANVAGTTITYDACNVPVVTTANGANLADGRYQPTVAQVNGHFTLTGLTFHKTITGEINGLVFSQPVGIPMQAVGPDISPYDAAKAHIVVSMGDAKTPCLKSGNTVVLDGHAEAVVKYVDAKGADVGASTNKDGLVWVSNITPGGTATFTVTSGVSGCKRGNAFYTGEMSLTADAVTTINISLKP